MRRRWNFALVLIIPSAASASEPAASVAVLDAASSSILFLDPATLVKTGQVRVGSGPAAMVVAPDGRAAYIPLYGGGPGDPNAIAGHQIACVDLKLLKLNRMIELAPHHAPWGIAVEASGLLWVTCEAEGTLLVVDPKRKEPVISRVPLGVKGSHRVILSPDGTRLYATSRDFAVISVVDPASRQLLREIRLSAPVDGIAVSPDGKKLFACSPDRRAVFVIETETSRVARELTVDEPPRECVLTPDGRTLLVTHREAGTVAIFDTESLRRQGVVRVGKSPAAIVTSPDGMIGYATNAGAGSVTAFEVESQRILRAVGVAKRPGAMAIIGK